MLGDCSGLGLGRLRDRCPDPRLLLAGLTQVLRRAGAYAWNESNDDGHDQRLKEWQLSEQVWLLNANRLTSRNPNKAKDRLTILIVKVLKSTSIEKRQRAAQTRCFEDPAGTDDRVNGYDGGLEASL